MKRGLIVLAWLLCGIFLFVGPSWAACPEDSSDNGVCDTLYIEVWPGDEVFYSFPHFVRFPIRVTNDIPDPSVDSICGLVIPLCFSSSNPAANVVIDPQYNKCGSADLYPFPDLNRSIFRHLPSMEDPQEHNFMMDYSEQMISLEWDTRILDISQGNNFWLSLVPTGTADQRFPGGSRVLVATITFTIVDTTTICIDTCFWPPTGHLAFSRSDAITYIPRHFLPVCQELGFPCPMPPFFTDGVQDQYHSANGHYVTDDFIAEDHVCGPIVDWWGGFYGEGVENVTVAVDFWEMEQIFGHVEYDVTDSCASGGYVVIYAENVWGNQGTEYFTINLPNDPPHHTLSDTWRALAGYTMLLEVTAADPNGDIIGDIELEAYWYQGDPLRPPTNPPSYEPGNPGNMTWAFAEPDTGVWICVFYLSDSCGAEGLDTLAIGVGLPFCGDCTGEGEINVADVVCLIGYLYRQGAAPDPLCRGDATGDGAVNVADIVVMVNYLFKGLYSPCFDCCDER